MISYFVILLYMYHHFAYISTMPANLVLSNHLLKFLQILVYIILLYLSFFIKLFD